MAKDNILLGTYKSWIDEGSENSLAAMSFYEPEWDLELVQFLCEARKKTAEPDKKRGYYELLIDQIEKQKVPFTPEIVSYLLGQDHGIGETRMLDDVLAFNATTPKREQLLVTIATSSQRTNFINRILAEGVSIYSNDPASRQAILDLHHPHFIGLLARRHGPDVITSYLEHADAKDEVLIALIKDNHLEPTAENLQRLVPRDNPGIIDALCNRYPQAMKSATLGGQFTPLDMALQHGHYQVARTLLEHGIPNSMDLHDPQLLKEGQGQLIAELAFVAIKVDDQKRALAFATHPHCSREALEKGTPPQNNPAIIQAQCFNQVETVQGLLALGISPNTTTKAGMSLAHNAIICKQSPDTEIETAQMQILRTLVAHPNYLPDLRDNSGQTALIEAITIHNFTQDGDRAAVKLLLDHGANPWVADNLGQDALHYAEAIGDKETIAMVKQAGKNFPMPAERNISDFSLATTSRMDQSLIKAIEGDGQNIGDIVGGGKVSLYATDRQGRNALYLAVESGDPTKLGMLMRYHPNVDAQTTPQYHPLALAAQKNDPALVEPLLSKHPKLDLYDNTGLAPLHYAVQHGEKGVAVAGLLAQQGANIDLPTLHTGKTPLMLSCVESAATTTTSMLLAAGANVHRRDMDGNTAAHYVVQGKCASAIHTLAEHHADLNAANKMQHTPLTMATKLQKNEVLKLLLAEGANPKIAGRDGVTPLMLASETGNEYGIIALHRAGAPLDKKDKHGMAAFDHAITSLGGESRVDLQLITLGAKLSSTAHYHTHKPSFTPAQMTEHLQAAIDGANKDAISTLKPYMGKLLGESMAEGHSPLTYAVNRGCKPAIQTLLNEGANPLMADSMGRTALSIAQAHNDKITLKAIETWKKSHPAEIHNALAETKQRHDNAADTIETVDFSKVDAVKKWVTETRSLDFPGLMDKAVTGGNIKVVNYLIEAGINVRDPGSRALSLASETDRVDLMKPLLAAGVNANEHGGRPLHAAREQGNLAADKLLLDHGAKEESSKPAGLKATAKSILNYIGGKRTHKVEPSSAVSADTPLSPNPSLTRPVDTGHNR
jgi:ankyrin repeat protein